MIGLRRSKIRNKGAFPCPLCGGVGHMRELFSGPHYAPRRKYVVTCDNKDCGLGRMLEFGAYCTEEEAIRVWRQRCKEVEREKRAVNA